MRLAEYRRGQDTVTRPVVAAVIGVLRALAGVPLSPAQWRLLLDALFPAVAQGRRASFALAVEFYLSQRAGHTDTAPPRIEPPPYESSALDHALRRTVSTRLSRPESARAAISDAAGAVARHVEQAGRDSVIAAATLDRARWARVPTGRETCAFCWMLASRGPVYTSRQAAGEMRTWHDRCDCQVVPVFNRDAWDGREVFLTAQRLWRDSTAGHSGRDALNAFRRSLTDTPGSLQTAA